ncbi:hypothetical protein [Caldanaerovirga acetigignens]|uniref:hypothetical protein n=1 Tax=Caldanaerovirga acetigignens TaxID=447595 RepID=UPI001160B9F5|nr:hypothetical protein [Caldanaerovirga acetigignens]
MPGKKSPHRIFPGNNPGNRGGKSLKRKIKELYKEVETIFNAPRYYVSGTLAIGRIAHNSPEFASITKYILHHHQLEFFCTIIGSVPLQYNFEI